MLWLCGSDHGINMVGTMLTLILQPEKSLSKRALSEIPNGSQWNWTSKLSAVHKKAPPKNICKCQKPQNRTLAGAALPLSPTDQIPSAGKIGPNSLWMTSSTQTAVVASTLRFSCYLRQHFLTLTMKLGSTALLFSPTCAKFVLHITGGKPS